MTSQEFILWLKGYIKASKGSNKSLDTVLDEIVVEAEKVVDMPVIKLEPIIIKELDKYPQSPFVTPLPFTCMYGIPSNYYPPFYNIQACTGTKNTDNTDPKTK